MKKDRFYFSHDYFARFDVKIRKLIRCEGLEGYGIYWIIIELLHENDGVIPYDIEQIAFDLRVKISKIENILRNFELFEVESNQITSKRVTENIEERREKSIRATLSVSKRYERSTDVELKNEYSTTIKERKGKESKVKEMKVKETKVKEASFSGEIAGTPQINTHVTGLEKKEQVDIHSRFISKYVKFYMSKIGVPYKFQGGNDGKAVKEMIAYIKKAQNEKNGAEPTDEQILDGWQFILDSYSSWESFYQAQMKLSQINSNMANIIANIKGIKTGKNNNTYEDDRIAIRAAIYGADK